MTRQQRKHRDKVIIEQIKKEIKKRDDRYKTNLVIRGSNYYKTKYEEYIKYIMSSFIKEV